MPKTKSPFFKVKTLHARLRDPLLTVLLAIQVFSIFIMPALRSAGINIPRVVVVSILLGFIALAISSSRSRVARIMLALSVALTIVGNIWHSANPDLLTNLFIGIGQVLTQLSLIWVVASAVFAAGRVTHHRILGAVIIYLSVGMVFTNLCIMIAQMIPGAITHLPTDNFDLREALTYYSFGTLTTGTFGDIVPVHPIVRSLANLEAICGQLFPATLLASIVGQFRPNDPSTE